MGLYPHDSNFSFSYCPIPPPSTLRTSRAIQPSPRGSDSPVRPIFPAFPCFTAFPSPSFPSHFVPTGFSVPPLRSFAHSRFHFTFLPLGFSAPPLGPCPRPCPHPAPPPACPFAFRRASLLCFTPSLHAACWPLCSRFPGCSLGYPSFPSPFLLSFFAGSIIVCICNSMRKCFSSHVVFQGLCPIAVSLFKKFRYLINILNKILAHFLSVHYFCTRHK